MVKNYFKIIDFISPKITLFYDSDKRYSTTIGGIFTIIILFAGIFCFINQILSLINYDINYIQHYRNYLDNFGPYEFNNNKNSFFIFANFLDSSKKNTIINLNKIRLIATFSTFTNINELSFFEKDHWLFANCNDLNLEAELIKLSEKDLKKAVCINYYYSSNEKKYYSINDQNFKKPKIERSSDSFTIFAYKCINNSITDQIYGNCFKENEEIDYINNQIFFIKLSFLTHQINTKDHKNTDKLYINSINSKIQMQNTYFSNSLTFSPLIIEKDIGLIFSDIITDKLYSFQGYTKTTEENLKTHDILNTFQIMFENLSHSYKLSYKTIYDLLAKEMILTETVYYILFFINYFLNLLAANKNMQNIIFHKKFKHDRKAIHLFSENYKYNLGSKIIKIKTIQNPLIIIDNKNICKNANKSDVSKNILISNKSSMLPLEENNNNNQKEQNNNIIKRKNFVDVCKNHVKYTEDKKFATMIFTKKDIFLFFKYLICNNWNNSPLVLFDSIQKKLLSVENLFQMHLMLLYIKKNNREINLMNIYKFFYE